MTLAEAKERVRNHRILASVLFTLTVVVSVMAILKGFYVAVQQDSGFSAAMFSGIQQLIARLYEKTQFVSLLWNVAPVPTIKDLNVIDNYAFLLAIALVVISTVIWDSASNLSKRIGAVERLVEEQGWIESITGVRAVTSSNGTPAIEINLVSRDQWYKRPIGLILIGVAIVAIGQWLILKLGLK